MFFNNKARKHKYNYVSEIDQFLQIINNQNKSNARIAEEQKYQRIFALRDHPTSTVGKNGK